MVVIFVIGEMQWVPTYMCAFGSAPAIGFALSPLIGFQVRDSFGDDATWTMSACLGVVAAVLGGLALAGVRGRLEEEAATVQG